MLTYTPKPGRIAWNWHATSAEDVILSRLASQVAMLPRGKHKPTYTPHIDGDDFVIVVNASKTALTDNKRIDDTHYSHSGHPGGLRAVPIGKLPEKNSREAVEHAVWGMLSKSKPSRRLIGGLRVYSGPRYSHAAQKSQSFETTRAAR